MCSSQLDLRRYHPFVLFPEISPQHTSMLFPSPRLSTLPTAVGMESIRLWVVSKVLQDPKASFGFYSHYVPEQRNFQMLEPSARSSICCSLCYDPFSLCLADSPKPWSRGPSMGSAANITSESPTRCQRLEVRDCVFLTIVFPRPTEMPSTEIAWNKHLRNNTCEWMNK